MAAGLLDRIDLVSLVFIPDNQSHLPISEFLPGREIRNLPKTMEEVKEVGIKAENNSLKLPDVILTRVLKINPLLDFSRYQLDKPLQCRKLLQLKELNAFKIDGRELNINLQLYGPFARNVDRVLQSTDLLCVEYPSITRQRVHAGEVEIDPKTDSIFQMFIGLNGEEKGGKSRITILRGDDAVPVSGDPVPVTRDQVPVSGDPVPVSGDPVPVDQQTEEEDSVSQSLLDPVIKPTSKGKGKGKNRPIPIDFDLVDGINPLDGSVSLFSPEKKTPRFMPKAVQSTPHKNLKNSESAEKSPLQNRPPSSKKGETSSEVNMNNADVVSVEKNEEAQIPTGGKRKRHLPNAKSPEKDKNSDLVPLKRLKYSKLNECVDKSSKYNVWAVCTKITREPGPTRKQKLMAQVYIRDEDCVGSYGFPDYQFSLMSNELGHFPPLTVNCVMRIHHMVVQEFNGSMTGRVFDARAVVTIAGGPDDPIVPEFRCDANNFKFSDEDSERVKELRLWWSLRNASQQLNLTEHKLKFCELVKEAMFDVYCQIKTIVKRKDGSVYAVEVTDGTRCPLNLSHFHSEELNTSRESVISLENEATRPNIFIDGHEKIFEDVTPGDYVLLKGVSCKKDVVNDNDKHMQAVVYKLVMEKPYDAECHKISLNHSAGRELKRTISNGAPLESQDDLELNELLEKINESPVAISSSNMFPDSQLFRDIVLDGLGLENSRHKCKDSVDLNEGGEGQNEFGTDDDVMRAKKHFEITKSPIIKLKRLSSSSSPSSSSEKKKLKISPSSSHDSPSMHTRQKEKQKLEQDQNPNDCEPEILIALESLDMPSTQEALERATSSHDSPSMHTSRQKVTQKLEQEQNPNDCEPEILIDTGSVDLPSTQEARGRATSHDSPSMHTRQKEKQKLEQDQNHCEPEILLDTEGLVLPSTQEALGRKDSEESLISFRSTDSQIYSTCPEK